MKRAAILTAVLMAFILAAWPLPAKADGGPMVDPLLFAELKEGQQVAVITLQDTNTASVDLFISILDQTGESHEIVFFVPLGAEADGFAVVEQDSFAFNDQFTNGLDVALFEGYREDQLFMQYLFAGALLTNGIWLTPLWLPLLFTGCAEPAAPISTFTTDSSEVSIFGLDESTDIESLISTTGLDMSVKETLSRLRGQQIAVVNLHTRPHVTATETGSESIAGGEPGLHLSWQTTLVKAESGTTYAYPLGTGAAWAHPIDMTRVYVVAPEELAFTVQYPELGVDRSGFARKQGSYEPRIADSGQEQAYAVDKTTTGQSVYPFHKRLTIWRITYMNSNAAEDIMITVKEASGISFGASLRRAGPDLAMIVGLLVAALFWIVTWYSLMPRLLGREGKIRRLWRLPLTYIGLNLFLFLPGVVLYVIFSFSEDALFLVPLVLLFGAASVLTFALVHLRKLGVSAARGIRAFIIVTLVSNGAYLLFVLGYAKLAGVL